MKKKPSQMLPEKKERFHREAESKIALLKYPTPTRSAQPKDVAWMSKSSLLSLIVQVVRDGGENNLHYHNNSETVWMVMGGRARFCGVGDTVLGELGPREAILMPGGARYWFEKVGPEDLEPFQIVGIDRANGDDERVNLDDHKRWMENDKFLKVYEEATPA